MLCNSDMVKVSRFGSLEFQELHSWAHSLYIFFGSEVVLRPEEMFCIQMNFGHIWEVDTPESVLHTDELWTYLVLVFLDPEQQMCCDTVDVGLQGKGLCGIPHFWKPGHSQWIRFNSKCFN